MSELKIGERKYRCQRCGTPMSDHGDDCVRTRPNAYDLSHNNLVEIDAAAGELLAAIMEFKSVESIQNSAYASEFFYLLDLRRRG